MAGDDFENIKTIVLGKLAGLSPYLTYHCIAHTMDVTRQVERIAHEENIINERDVFLLKVAALYHDTGFLETYRNHEIISCNIFIADALKTSFDDKEITLVYGLIMATKIPQKPSTELEKIICDADLDYLGRSDFFIIGDTLRKEFVHYNIVPDNAAWEKLQLEFLQHHTYHTKASQEQREPVKQQNLAKLFV